MSCRFIHSFLLFSLSWISLVPGEGGAAVGLRLALLASCTWAWAWSPAPMGPCCSAKLQEGGWKGTPRSLHSTHRQAYPKWGPLSAWVAATSRPSCCWPYYRVLGGRGGERGAHVQHDSERSNQQRNAKTSSWRNYVSNTSQDQAIPLFSGQTGVALERAWLIQPASKAAASTNPHVPLFLQQSALANICFPFLTCAPRCQPACSQHAAGLRSRVLHLPLSTAVGNIFGIDKVLMNFEEGAFMPAWKGSFSPLM